MNCPNCEAPKLRTVETFQTPLKTIRTKKCMTCLWTFTSMEEVSVDLEITKELRDSKRKKP